MARQPCRKKIDDQDHECERDKKGHDDFLDAFRDRTRGVQRHDKVQVFREAFCFICAISLLTPAAASTAFDPGS